MPVCFRKSANEETYKHFAPRILSFAFFQVWMNVYNLYRDDKLWEQPFFKPERFLDSDGRLVAADHPNKRRYFDHDAFFRGEIIGISSQQTGKQKRQSMGASKWFCLRHGLKQIEIVSDGFVAQKIVQLAVLISEFRGSDWNHNKILNTNGAFVHKLVFSLKIFKFQSIFLGKCLFACWRFHRFKLAHSPRECLAILCNSIRVESYLHHEQTLMSFTLRFSGALCKPHSTSYMN